MGSIEASEPPARPDREMARADREKRRVALSSLLAAVALTAMKTIVGLATNSLGVLSEAVHSALDLVAAGVTFWAVRISGQPADREHTYGHGKFENLSALFETLLLLAACVWIIYEALARMFFAEEVHVEASLWAFVVIGVSIVVDFSRSRALKKVARKYDSQALEADALHFSTDIWSSGVVLLGLAAVAAAEKLNLPWLVGADALAALGVAVIVISLSLKLGRKSVADLLDSIPQELREKAAAAAAAVPGVEKVTQLRIRRSGPEVFADLTLTVGHVAAFETAHEIASRVEAALRALLPTADVVVHVEPAAPTRDDLTTTIRAVAARHDVGAHGIRIYEEDAGRSVEMHLEVDESLSLDEAHRQATEFEGALRESVPELARIVTHIEPAGDGAATFRTQPAGELEVREALDEFLRIDAISFTSHDLKAQMAGGELAVSFHCTLDADTAITAAHGFTQRLEEFLRARVPNLGRVVIHVEPAEGKRGHATFPSPDRP